LNKRWENARKIKAKEWLWKAKLKLRNAFLAILAFMPVSRSELKSFTTLLSAGGTAFYFDYVNDAWQFWNHNEWRESYNYQVDANNFSTIFNELRPTKEYLLGLGTGILRN